MVFLSKDLISPDLGNLADAIKEVNSGVNYFLGSDNIAIKFTNMEALIIPELCQGKTSQTIAGELNLSEKSIEKHKHNIYKKTQSKTAGEFFKHAFKGGLEFLGRYNRKIKIKG